MFILNRSYFTIHSSLTLCLFAWKFAYNTGIILIYNFNLSLLTSPHSHPWLRPNTGKGWQYPGLNNVFRRANISMNHLLFLPSFQSPTPITYIWRLHLHHLRSSNILGLYLKYWVDIIYLHAIFRDIYIFVQNREEF